LFVEFDGWRNFYFLGDGNELHTWFGDIRGAFKSENLVEAWGYPDGGSGVFKLFFSKFCLIYSQLDVVNLKVSLVFQMG